MTSGLKSCIASIIMFLISQIAARFDSSRYSYEQNGQQVSNQQPEIIGEPLVICTHRFMIITIQTSKPLVGRIYVEDREYDERCSAEFSPSNSHNSTIRIPILPCLIIDEASGNKDQLILWAYLRINFHQVLITGQSRLFRIECSSLTKTQVLDDVQQPGMVNTICHHKIKSPTFPYRVGRVFFHEWTCAEEYDSSRYLMLCRECSVISRTKSSVLLIDEFGCIVDNNLISNLHNGVDHGPQKFTALSQIFKFPGEDDIRFRCKILLVPRTTIERSAVKIPKCAGLDLSYKETPSIQSLPEPSSITFPDQIETMTLTDWIKVNDSEEDEALFEISNSKWSGTISSLDELYKDRESRRSSRYSHRTRMALKHSHLDSSQAQPLLSTEIADLQPIQIEKYEELEARMNATKRMWHLFNNGNFNVSEINEWIRMGNKTGDWRLNDLVLNQTDESLHIFAHSANNSRFNLTLPLQNKNCSTRMLNLLLLIWSILSTVAWLILLAYRIYRFLAKDYGPSMDEVDERFTHESENANAHLYMPWLDPHSDWQGGSEWRKPTY